MRSAFSMRQPKIAPHFQAGIHARMDTFDTSEIGPTVKAKTELAEKGLSLPNLPTMRHYRLNRITAELQKRDIDGAFDYTLEPGMTLCVETYTGKVGGVDGVKLENQVLITDNGFENLTPYPYEERLLNHV